MAVTKRYAPGTTAFRHNASPRQQAGFRAKEFAQTARGRLERIIANWDGQPDQHDVNLSFAALVRAALALVPHVTEAVSAQEGTPYGNEREAAALEALQKVITEVK
jgi:hypothetical protein